MKKFLATILIMTAAIGIFKLTCAEDEISMSVPYTDEQQLKDLYQEMWQALIAKDIATLDKIHAEDFVLVHMTGLHQPKAEYLRCVREGELNYFSEQTDNIFVDVKNKKLIGQSKVNAAVFGGSRNTWRLQLDFDVEKINGQWI